MKIFDIVDEHDQIIGSAPAAECHSNPQRIHRVVHFTLIDRAHQRILIAHRSSKVKFDSGMWCFMGEHLLRGDDYSQAIFRGVANELGFSPDGIEEKCHTIFRSEHQTELARFYIVNYKGETITPNSAEISQVKWITLAELYKEKHTYSTMTQYWIDRVDWDTIMIG